MGNFNWTEPIMDTSTEAKAPTTTSTEAEVPTTTSSEAMNFTWMESVETTAEASAACVKYDTDGWHVGTEVHSLPATDMTWEECAAECAIFDGCEFWTLQLKNANPMCKLQADQGAYVAGGDGGHYEGDKIAACAEPSGSSGNAWSALAAAGLLGGR